GLIGRADNLYGKSAIFSGVVQGDDAYIVVSGYGVLIVMDQRTAERGIAQQIKEGKQAGIKALLPCANNYTAGYVADEVVTPYVDE
ncbi:hypothetical protein, partial [Pseudomonas syringae group genomosp. 7]|uniref:hypothetical protein n=1 Tax=Pseudomonas syringae group genomosp. 7 TaxID=251699 RepID=UPI0037703D36